MKSNPKSAFFTAVSCVRRAFLVLSEGTEPTLHKKVDVVHGKA